MFSQATSGCKIPVVFDETLVAAVESQQNADTLFRMERELEEFLFSPAHKHQFPPSTSYMRLMAHRISHHFNLKHTVVTPAGMAPASRAVCGFKTPETRLPAIRLCDLFLPAEKIEETAATLPAETAAPEPAKLLLRRRPGGEEPAGADRTAKEGAGSAQKSENNVAPRPALSEEEREAKYMAAKVRIFGREGVEALEKEDISMLPPLSSPPRSPSPSLSSSPQVITHGALYAHRSPPRSPHRSPSPHRPVDLFADADSSPRSSQGSPARRPLSASASSFTEFVPRRASLSSSPSSSPSQSSEHLERKSLSPGSSADAPSVAPSSSTASTSQDAKPAAQSSGMTAQEESEPKEFSRPPVRTEKKLFDPNVPAYSMSAQARQFVPRAAVPYQPQQSLPPYHHQPPHSYQQQHSAAPQPTSGGQHGRALELPHVRMVAGPNMVVEDIIKQCQAFNLRNARIWFNALVVVFASAADAAKAETEVLSGLAVKPLTVVVAVTDPNARSYSPDPNLRVSPPGMRYSQ